MMRIEGQLHIDIYPSACADERVSIASSRPLGLSRALIGQTADAAVRTLPLLFSICGMAQGAAAVEAAGRAMGTIPDAGTQMARQLLVLTEAAREHLIHAVIEWSKQTGTKPGDATTLSILRATEALRSAIDPHRTCLTLGATTVLDTSKIVAAVSALQQLIEDLVLGETAETFLARERLTDLLDWSQKRSTPAQTLIAHVQARNWADAGAVETALLPDLSNEPLTATLLGDSGQHFAAHPAWRGQPHETTAFGRQAQRPLIENIIRSCGSGLMARLTARIVELAALPGQLKDCARCQPAQEPPCIASHSPSRGIGIAHIEAARGRLIHAAEIEGGIVRRYAIVAPTEWNFHSDGIAKRALTGIADQFDDVAQVAGLYVSALDPCVNASVRVH